MPRLLTIDRANKIVNKFLEIIIAQDYSYGDVISTSRVGASSAQEFLAAMYLNTANYFMVHGRYVENRKDFRESVRNSDALLIREIFDFKKKEFRENLGKTEKLSSFAEYLESLHPEEKSAYWRCVYTRISRNCPDILLPCDCNKTKQISWLKSIFIK